MTPPRHPGRHGDGCGQSHLSGAWNGNVGMELPKTIGYREKMRQELGQKLFITIFLFM